MVEAMRVTEHALGGVSYGISGMEARSESFGRSRFVVQHMKAVRFSLKGICILSGLNLADTPGLSKRPPDAVLPWILSLVHRLARGM